jgi:hypothetical protein
MRTRGGGRFDKWLEAAQRVVVAGLPVRHHRRLHRSTGALVLGGPVTTWPRRPVVGFALLALGVLAALLSLSQIGRADEQVLPISLEAELFAKVLTYDKNFPARAGQLARVLLVQKQGNADSSRVAAQMQSALRTRANIGGIPHEVTIVTFGGAASLAELCKANGATALFLGPGFDDDVDAIRTALDGYDLLTAGSVPEYVPRGIVLGFDIVSGSPKVLVHLTQAKRQNVSLRAELLRMARIFE